MQNPREGQGGFTLLELLISLVIFSFIALAAYQALRVLVDSQDLTARRSTELRSLIRAVNFLETDMQQIMLESFQRPSKGQGLYGPSNGELLERDELKFIRGGWSSLLGDQQAKIMRVRWRLQDGALRRTYRAFYESEDAQPQTQAVLDNVLSFKVRYLDSENLWRDDWTSGSEQGGEPLQRVPKAIKVRIQHSIFGDIQRLFLMPQPLEDVKDDGDSVSVPSEQVE